MRVGFQKIFWVLLCLTASAGMAAAGDSGYLSVTGPCRLEFPRDHGPHPGFRTEWWYWTGNLKSETGRRFGFQLTFFRHQLTPFGGTSAWPDPPSAWRSRQIYLGHAALSDMAGKRHFQTERAVRQALGLGGWVRWGPDITLFLRNWYAVILPDAHRLHAEGDAFDFTLEMKPVKGPVRHGIDGYSRKGATPERASCYYSFSRLETTGTVTVGGKSFEVEGESWMDHEFSTAPLEPGTLGWDWFSIQLADKTEIMIYLLRQKDGELSPASSGTYIDASGALRHLERGYFQVVAKESWKSPRSGAVYPQRWSISIPLLGIDLELSANLADQEMRTAGTTGVTYWEGSVAVKGTKGSTPVEGHGYVEMTGYTGPVSALQ
jgi:predicted secreted hydrolase